MSIPLGSDLLAAKSKLKSKSTASASSNPTDKSKSLNTLDHDALIASTPVDHEDAVHHCNIEQWLPLLQSDGHFNTTPLTQFCEISKDNAKLMMKIYEIFEENQRSKKFKHFITKSENEPKANKQSDSDDNKNDSSNTQIVDLFSLLPSHLSSGLLLYEKFLKEHLSTLSIKSKSTTISTGTDRKDNENTKDNDKDQWSDLVFVKTSSRSAKNSVREREQFVTNYQKEFLRTLHLYQHEEMKSDPTRTLFPSELLNLKLTALVRSCTTGLQFSLSNPREILSILCKSRRIYDDLDAALEYLSAHPTAKWEQNIVLRQWIPVNPILEFRCFVCKGEMRAISQYTTMVFSPIIMRKHKEIKNKIMEFWYQNCRSQLLNDKEKRYESYVLDVGFLDPKGYYNDNSTASEGFFTDDEYLSSLICIELNPFYFTTHGALFQWNDKEDNHILTNTKTTNTNDPTVFPVFRYVEKLLDPAYCMSSIDEEWRTVIQNVKLQGDNGDKEEGGK